MTGLDKMKSQILDEARAEADQKLQEAKAQADEIVAQAQAAAAKSQESISQKSEAEIVNYKERMASSIDLRRRTKILKAKQEMIAEVLGKAYEKLRTMDTDEYFAMLTKILEKYVLPEEGELFLSAEDLARMPRGFEDDAVKTAKERGGSLKVSKESKKIENGFVLVYGGIEENCTLQAMFDAKKDDLSDQVHRILFM